MPLLQLQLLVVPPPLLLPRSYWRLRWWRRKRPLSRKRSLGHRLLELSERLRLQYLLRLLLLLLRVRRRVLDGRRRSDDGSLRQSPKRHRVRDLEEGTLVRISISEGTDSERRRGTDLRGKWNRFRSRVRLPSLDSAGPSFHLRRN